MENQQMIASRRTRWFKGLGFLLVGLFVVVGLSYWFQYQQRLDAERQELSEMSYNMLGFLELREGKLGIAEGTEERFKQAFHQYGFDEPANNRFAYAVNTSTNEIIWSAADALGKTAPDGELRFYLNAPFTSPAKVEILFEQARPLKPATLTADPQLQQRYEQNYLLAIQDIQSGMDIRFIVGKPFTAFGD